MHRLNPTQLTRSRELRAEPTDAELALWRRLRGRQLAGAKFRRQHPLGPFVADFACLPARLVIEVDGGQHAASRHDLERDRWMHERGWRVLRFWNHEVLGNLDGVLEVVAQAVVASTPPPRPSPWEGEGVDAPVLLPSVGAGRG